MAIGGGGAGVIRTFGVRLVVLEGDSFTRASQQVVQANQAQANSLRALRQAHSSTAGSSGLVVRSLREMASNIAVLDGPLGGVASRFNAFATALTRAGPAMVAFGLAAAAIGFTLRRTIPVVSQFEQSTARMAGVMRATGGQIGLTANEMETFSRQIALNTLASVNDTRDAFSELATSGVVFGETAKNLIVTAQDLTQVFGGSLNQNLDLLTRGVIDIDGAANSFRRRFGIDIPDALKRSIAAMQELGNTQGAANALIEFLAGRVGGQGITGAFDTIAGSIDTLSQRWQEFLESFAGGPFIEGLKQFLNTTASEINAITEVVNDVAQRGGWLNLLFGNFPVLGEVKALLDAMTQASSGPSGTGAQSFGARIQQVLRDTFTGLEQQGQQAQEAASKVVEFITQELGLREEVAENLRQEAASQALAQHGRLVALQREAEAEGERKTAVEAAAAARQRELVLQAEQKRLAEEAEKAARAAAQLEEQRNAKQIQELLRVEGIIERLQSRLIDLRGGSTFEQIQAREGGTSAFLLNREEIQGLADRGDNLKRFQEQLKISNDFINESIREQRQSISAMAKAVSGELVGAWRQVTQAIIEGTDVLNAFGLALLGILQGAAERVAGNFIAAGLESAITPATASFFGFAHGGSFAVGAAGGASVTHMIPPKGGIFAGRAQSGLDFMIPGGGATDSVPVSFLATPGERVTVAPPGARGGSDINLNFSFTGSDPDLRAGFEVLGSHLVEQAVSRSVGRVLDLATRDRTARRIIGGRRR